MDHGYGLIYHCITYYEGLILFNLKLLHLQVFLARNL